MNSWLVNKRVAWFTKLLFFIILLSGFTGCVSYDRALQNKVPLNKENLEILNGSFAIVSNEKDSVSYYDSRQVWMYNNIINELNRKQWLRNYQELDSTASYAINFKVLSPDSLLIKYVRNDSVFSQKKYKTKLKKDGYLYLKNQNFKILGVPFVFGFFETKRTRFSVTEEGSLIFDTAESNIGGCLLIMLIGIKKDKERFIYNTINAPQNTTLL